MIRNYYEILGVAPGSTEAEIRDAYHKLARKYHPDFGGDGERFDEINEAYRFLSDKVKRLALDAQLRVRPARRPAPQPAQNAAQPKKEREIRPSAPVVRPKPRAKDYSAVLEEQVGEYEKLLLSLSRCSVSPARPELAPSSLELLVRKNKSARERLRKSGR